MPLFLLHNYARNAPLTNMYLKSTDICPQVPREQLFKLISATLCRHAMDARYLMLFKNLIIHLLLFMFTCILVYFQLFLLICQLLQQLRMLVNILKLTVSDGRVKCRSRTKQLFCKPTRISIQISLILLFDVRLTDIR